MVLIFIVYKKNLDFEFLTDGTKKIEKMTK